MAIQKYDAGFAGRAYNVCNVHVSKDVRELEKTSVVEEMLHAASMIEFELF